MYAVVRRYSGGSAPKFVSELEVRDAEVRELMTTVPGFLAYYMVKDAEGGFSVTVCQDREGTLESTRRATQWVKENLASVAVEPDVVEGETIFHFVH
ncbi:hypothetical protein [Wenjunlia tyrosinilytica]|uniref:ABM domain-containing protein n=1 Tax=Wenjunlia tyrosinilytica TaxID=1544741 RepID=A0A917ZR76_9ACTN|nr:hypothetical protein [Wenjunlia tyrosinilytica]GGO90791.1 hypothetical protein GCM10012280_37130 [Wenjunlia tyrosinilytica]